MYATLASVVLSIDVCRSVPLAVINEPHARTLSCVFNLSQELYTNTFLSPLTAHVHVLLSHTPDECQPYH